MASLLFTQLNNHNTVVSDYNHIPALQFWLPCPSLLHVHLTNPKSFKSQLSLTSISTYQPLQLHKMSPHVTTKNPSTLYFKPISFSCIQIPLFSNLIKNVPLEIFTYRSYINFLTQHHETVVLLLFFKTLFPLTWFLFYPQATPLFYFCSTL